MKAKDYFGTNNAIISFILLPSQNLPNPSF